MSESSNESKTTGRIAGWINAAIAAVFSAVSGAALMYASPLVDSVIKPAKPVANFQAQPNGLKVTFQNRSIGGLEGWWDFGDGSAMEPFVPEDPAVTHAYAKGGTYTVKLSLKNLIHEQNDRVATVTLDGTTLTDQKPPSIDALRIVPVSGDYAPASFQVSSTVKDADMCVWILGERQVEFSPDTANGNQQRIVTFKQPGTHVIRLAAFNGKQAVEKTETVVVKKAPIGMVTATLNVTYEAVRIEQRSKNQVVAFQFPAQQKGDASAVTQQIAADQGFEITAAEIVQPIKSQIIKSAKVQLDPTKRGSVQVVCEMVKPAKGAVAPTATVQVALTQQRQSPPTVKTAEPVSVLLTPPGSAVVPLPPLPPGWKETKRHLNLTLQQDGKQIGVFDGVMPKNAAVQLPGAVFSVTVVEEPGQLQLTVRPRGAASTPSD